METFFGGGAKSMLVTFTCGAAALANANPNTTMILQEAREPTRMLVATAAGVRTVEELEDWAEASIAARIMPSHEELAALASRSPPPRAWFEGDEEYPF